MAISWVLVANGTRAKLFQADGPLAGLREIGDYVHPEGRMHETELTSDLPGLAFDRHGQGKHAYSTEVEPKKHEAIAFAKELSDRLEKARGEGRFRKLYVIASPSFLGHLRDHFSESLAKTVVLEIDKDLTLMRPEEIRSHLPERL